MSLIDGPARIEAIDPNGSFIVQAPAGSGKTELLTQRYLRLLSVVNAPEEILALTFTRKAASEMRERILTTLQKAANNLTPKPHQRDTFDYANLALARSKSFNWELIKHPNRLRIMTIDAFCQLLCQSIPVQEKQIPFAKVTENPYSLYLLAVQNFLDYLYADPNYHPDIKRLLHHVDNRQERLIQYFIQLLVTRDAWLPFLYLAQKNKKMDLDNWIYSLKIQALEKIKEMIPLIYRDDLCQLACHLANLENKPNSPRAALKQWTHYMALDLEIMEGLVALLLTSQNTLRLRFDHHVGLNRTSCEGNQYKVLKTKSEELLQSLTQVEGLTEALINFRELPNLEYPLSQWDVSLSLCKVLPLLVGHLHLVFQEKGKQDFNAISEQALNALGSEEEPTDLALYWDNAIHHILVDEFQDTSIQQFELLQKLIQEWNPKEGKTLFLVGDPMQSIYRFRQAQVGLFLKAKAEGIGPILLKPLELNSNFRSTSPLVEWVNQHFKTIFPKINDMSLGAISFLSSHPAIPSQNAETPVKAYQCMSRDHEAASIIEVIKQERENYPNDSIAILVRSRSQLLKITRELRKHKLLFQGMEVEHLSSLPHLKDAWSLTKCLLMPANRLAWLSFLRSPFCGLSLQDLYLVANFDKKLPIFHALSNLDKIKGLSKEASTRLRLVFSILDEAIAFRYQDSLVSWISLTFKKLKSDLILNEQEQDDLEQFWILLEQLTTPEQILDIENFTKELNQLYSKCANVSPLKVMTIHKSKGLEFDCIILPGLSSQNSNKDHPFFRTLVEKNEKFIFCPIKSAKNEECSVYSYLGQEDNQKEYYESQRLLYVAVTRAKKRLYLFDYQEKETSKSFKNFLKNQPFDPYPDDSSTVSTMQFSSCVAFRKRSNPEPSYLHRLPLHLFESFKERERTSESMTIFNLSSVNLARPIGVVAHELLQWICDNHPTSTQVLPWHFVINRFRGMGFSEEEQHQALELIKNQITSLFENTIGQWIIASHEEEKNELAFLIEENETMGIKMVDRTFLFQGERWIIDFKTGKEDETSQALYQKQVNAYATLFSHEPYSIRCGIYYLATSHWLSWAFDKIQQEATSEAENVHI